MLFRSLDAELLAQADDLLSDHDAVMGPSRDGGYYLIGFNRAAYRADYFLQRTSGRSHPFHDFAARLRAAGATWGELPGMIDVDTAEDLRAAYRGGEANYRALHEAVRRFVPELAGRKDIR